MTYRKRTAWREEQRRIRRRKATGWGMDLYRNPVDGKLAGVCAGIADYWDVAPWVVRLLFIGLFFFTGTLVFWAYLAGWLLLARRPLHHFGDGYVEPVYSVDEDDLESEYDERRHERRTRRPFKYAGSTAERMRRARERLDAAMGRVAAMESYVTSRKYDLNREFSRL
jgi:phage shock protein C